MARYHQDLIKMIVGYYHKCKPKSWQDFLTCLAKSWKIVESSCQDHGVILQDLANSDPIISEFLLHGA
jgi:hypothetical protein